MKLIDRIESTYEHLGNIRSALSFYESALKKAYPNGAPDDVWQFWNLARIYLFEEAPKKEGEQ